MSSPNCPSLEWGTPSVQEFDNLLGVEAVSSANAPTEREIPDRLDEVLIATLPTRRWEVKPGDVVALPVTVFNNSRRKLCARVYVEGWLDERWMVEPYVQAGLEPGERITLELNLSPPRHPGVEAGDHPLAVVVRAPEEPMRMVRLGFTLRVLPFKRLALDVRGMSGPSAWWRRTLEFSIRLSNQGNCPLTVRLEGRTMTSVAALRLPGGETFALAPGEHLHAPLRLTVHRLPWIGLHSRELPFTVHAYSDEGETLAQVRRSVEVYPILGLWQLAAIGALGTVTAASALLLVIVSVMMVRYTATPPQPAVAGEPAPAVIVVALNQPIASAASSSSAPAQLADAPRLQPEPSAPLVLPDQVTAPGSGGPVRSLAAPSTDASASPAGRPMTYAQMFQTIAAQYDLDWRMLAAQAYVESGFDSLALSSAGAMGLMQVLPTTWREWAPVVGVNDPFDSYSNVQVAAVYLDYLRTQLARQGRPEKEWMLVAYHWGIDRLGAFLAEGGDWQTLPELHRRYAEDILRIARTLP
ncbi:MAG: transglycosylase SLT domain-containing protein [Caldilinea sp.]|nr:transglycosylase SLT domain-containing protein [Caldilinea sp.]MDW8440172.1 transglycosylase SLT domain-containing protein [Caldilineaceae bacterium]